MWNGNVEWTASRTWSGTVSRRARRGNENGDQLVGLACYRMNCVGQQAQLLDQLEPVERLAQLLGGNGHLVDEIGATLCVTRFVVVGASRSARTNELKSNMPGYRIPRHFLSQVDDVGSKRKKAFGDVTAAFGSIAHVGSSADDHVGSSADDREELLPFHIPIPPSTLHIRLYLDGR